mmetsp:Transcript_42344/g.99601  ORF Transcript_42344/g.99601 Transcript_42344/m.99601 type:complete len:241 (+) Transcript_42344:880-1602(+)
MRHVVVIEQPEVGCGRNQVGVVGDGFGKFGLAAWAAVVGRTQVLQPIGGVGRRCDRHGGNRQPAPVVGAFRWHIGIAPLHGQGCKHRRRKHAPLEIAVRVVAQLLGLDGRHAGHHHHGLVGRKLHYLARREQRTCRLLARHHQMPEPWREPVAGVVALRAQLGRGAQRFGDALGGALVVGGERHPDMAVVQDRMVLAVGFVNLVERLGDEEAADTVAGHEGQGRLEEVEPSERGELVEHQ